MAFQIRTIEAPDDERLKQIIVSALHESHALKPNHLFSTELESLSAYYAQPKARYWVLQQLESGLVVGGGGYALLKGSDPQEAIAEIQKMYIASLWRGKGLGKRLLNVILETARADGYGTFYLETYASMMNAVGLYKRFGFEFLSQPMGDTGHSGECSIFMKRPALLRLD